MPSTATDRLQGLTTSVAVKPPCVTVATSNITLSGLQTISGYTTVEGDRVLVKGQTNPVENGIYLASTGSWIRAKDADGNRDFVQGTRVLVRSSTIDGVEYELTTANPIVIGTSSLTFVLRYGANATFDQSEAEIAAAVVPTNYGHPPGDLRRYGGVGDGATVSTTALSNAAAQAAQTNGAVVIIAGGTYRIAANTTLSAAVALDFSEGGMLSIDSGITLSHQGAVFANPGRQIFTGSGTVLFGTSPTGSSRSAVAEVYPEWWGARADLSTNCTNAVASAIASLRWGGVVKFTGGVYMLDSITAATGVALKGVGKDQSLLKLRASRSSPFLLLDNPDAGIANSGGFCIADLTIDGNGFAAAGCHGVQVNDYSTFSLRDCYVHSFDKGVYFHGAIIATLYRCRIEDCQVGFEGNTNASTLNAVALRDCKIGGCATWGVRVTEGSQFEMSGGTIEACGTAANANTGGMMLDDMDRDGLGIAAIIDGIWFESNSGAAGIVITSPNVNYSVYSIRGVHIFGGTRTYGLYVNTSATFAYLHLSHSKFQNAGTTDLSIASATVGVVDNVQATTSSIAAADLSILNHPANGRYDFPTLSLRDGVTAPAAQTNYAHIYVDTADGDLKVKFADGVIKTLATDT